MAHSMTGFGRCRGAALGRELTVEIKSVNNRYLDCSVKLSRTLGHLEEKIKPYLQSRGISRGKVDVWITSEGSGEESGSIGLNAEYLKGYLQALYELRDSYGLADDISVMTVARNQEIFKVTKPQEDAERDWAALLPILTEAVDGFLASRRREGESLCRDILGKLAGLREVTDRIEQLSENSPSQYRERLAERVRAALADNHITPDESRLLTECAVYADKVAIDEELVRLRTHFDAMEQALQSEEPIGRRLDFLVQEMNREINTTGSKCNHAEIAQLVVGMKCEMEKIREQLQNLE